MKAGMREQACKRTLGSFPRVCGLVTPLKVVNYFPSDRQYHSLALRMAWKEQPVGGSSCRTAWSPEGKERMRGERHSWGGAGSAQCRDSRSKGQLEGRTRRLLKSRETHRRLRTDMGQGRNLGSSNGKPLKPAN